MKNKINKYTNPDYMKASDRYSKYVEWSDEDQAYIGTCPELFFGGCHGDNKDNVYTELCGIVDEVAELETGHDSPHSEFQLKTKTGSLHVYTHPYGVTVVIDGNPDDDAAGYQETELAKALQAVEDIRNAPRGVAGALPRHKAKSPQS